jgi:hypothetical protein
MSGPAPGPARSLLLALLLVAGRPEPAAANGESAAAPPRSTPVRQVVVHRGRDADLPSAVPVHRGHAAAPARAPAEPTPATALVEGGRRLWLVDRDRGTLTACRLVSTSTVGRDAIRCTRRRLPAS